MKLAAEIRDSLWTAIAGTYGNGHYSHAIVDAVHFLTKTIRERSGLDGDGAQLVGQALGGESPKLKVTPLETESDRNVQKGVEQILRGLYQGIRNPRSHDQNIDSKEIADAVIVFIDYLIGLIDSSEESFTIEGFQRRISDSAFVETRRYAELLVSEISALRRLEALSQIFRERRQLDLRKLRTLIGHLLGQLSETQMASYLQMASDHLRDENEDVGIRTVLQMLTPDLWPRIGEIARLRIENKMLSGLSEGEVLQSGKTTQPLATWSRAFLQNFTERRKAEVILVKKLEDDDRDDRRYVARFSLASFRMLCRVRSMWRGALVLLPQP